MLDHSKPEFAQESETLKDFGSSSQKMAPSWKSPLSLQNSRDFPALFQAKPFLQHTLYSYPAAASTGMRIMPRQVSPLLVLISMAKPARSQRPSDA